MLRSQQVMAFLATANPKKAIAFYRDKLGLRLTEDSPFALVLDVKGTMLRIQKVEKVSVAPYTALGWQVKSIAGTIRKLNAKGVTMERFPGLDQDELGVWQSPSGARIAWFKDPEGHTLSLTQF
jgi:catechol 2,3-dioxygenase-like lactoylglutathione lyase family enzyme